MAEIVENVIEYKELYSSLNYRTELTRRSINDKSLAAVDRMTFNEGVHCSEKCYLELVQSS